MIDLLLFNEDTKFDFLLKHHKQGVCLKTCVVLDLKQWVIVVFYTIYIMGNKCKPFSLIII